MTRSESPCSLSLHGILSLFLLHKIIPFPKISSSKMLHPAVLSRQEATRYPMVFGERQDKASAFFSDIYIHTLYYIIPFLVSKDKVN